MRRGMFERATVWLLPGLLVLSGCYSGIDLEGVEGVDAGGGDLSGGQDGGDAGDDGGDGAGDDGAAELCADGEVGITGLRRLTASQYDHTVRDLLGVETSVSADFAPDERVGPFKSNVASPLGELQVEQYMQAAETVANQVATDLAAVLPCDPTGDEDACAREFVEEFVPRAYRRPVPADEIDRLMQVYGAGKTEGGFDNGIRVLVSGVLQSPYFLYHVEFGVADGSDGSAVELSGHEIASRMSYFLWDTMPDDALFDAADSGALATDEGLAAEVDRMLQDPRAQDAIASFHLQWLGVDEIEDMEKAAELYPAFDAELAEAMKQETARFASFAVLEDDGKLDTLLTAPYTLTEDPALLELYGATLPLEYQPGDPIPLDPTQRAGVLTQAGVLAHHAHPDQSSPILRGVLVRQNFFCQMLPPPPPDVDNVPPSPDPDATTREQFSQHTADPACAGCHQLIDPLGFGLENYDATGAFRRLEGDNPVDASGELLGTDVDGAFDGGVALSHVMAQSDQVRECVSRQWFRFAFGRSEAMEDSCTLDRLNQAFAASDFEIKALLRELVVSDAFRFRRSAPVTDAAPAQEDER